MFIIIVFISFLAIAAWVGGMADRGWNDAHVGDDYWHRGDAE